MPTRKSATLGRTLDARPDRLDLRDRPYLPPVASLPPAHPADRDIARFLPAYVKAGLILDQKGDGACTGFGLACVIHYLFWRRTIQPGRGRRRPVTDRVSTRMLYHLARFYDEWAGEDYDGSSCRGALKAWHKHGVCTETLWPYLDARRRARFVSPKPGWDLDAFRRRLGVYYRINHRSVVDMQAAIVEIGAVYVSADVHDGWDVVKTRRTLAQGHASLPVVGPVTDPNSIGGHAFAIVGYNPTGFVVQNSWGKGWGHSGFAVLPYDDWVKHGSDAWACALGVPGVPGEVSPGVLRPSASSATEPRTPSGAAAPAMRPRPAQPRRDPAVEPWPLDRAYQHTVVLGNEGRPINRLVTDADGAASIGTIAATSPAAWFAAHPGPRRLAVYAHGGLNPENDALARVRVMAPYFEANGIYPVFVAWKTGALESVSDILDDALAGQPQPQGGIFGDVARWVAQQSSEVVDRTVEVVARPVVKPIWGQMKQNAEASAEAGRGGRLLVDQITALAAAGPLELHLVGHSAGSILLGHFLTAAQGRGLAVRSCSLFAPACTVSFALTHYRSAVQAGTLQQQDLHLHLLSDARERDDAVGPYRKSLLYLVSRALESAHKTPVLGLARAFDSSPALVGDWHEGERQSVRDWQQWWTKAPTVLDAPQVRTGPGTFIKTAHGCFDNDVDTITTTLRRMLGGQPLAHPVEALDF